MERVSLPRLTSDIPYDDVPYENTEEWHIHVPKCLIHMRPLPTLMNTPYHLTHHYDYAREVLITHMTDERDSIPARVMSHIWTSHVSHMTDKRHTIPARPNQSCMFPYR